MPHANIVGAGIAGPTAAITLRMHGFSVDVWETRQQRDLHSDGILGITPDSWDLLQAYETDAPAYSLSESGHDLDGLVWTDLHQSLTRRAVQLGANFHYGQTFGGNYTDLTVWATGVGSAKEVTEGHYTGYTIIRGLSSRKSGSKWTQIDRSEPDGTDWYFMAGDIPSGTSIAMFVPRPNPTFHTTYSTECPPEIDGLPYTWQRIAESVPEWQIVPMSDWDVPENMVTNREVSPIVRVGDANGQLRPMTAMGANLAMQEASDVELLIECSEDAEQRRLDLRRTWHGYGQATGIRA